MKLTLLKNPYTTKKKTVECSHIQFNIEESEWQKVLNGVPFHGTQDSFFSTLYQKFLTLCEDELPICYDIDSEEIVVDIINRLELRKKNETPAFKGRTTKLQNVTH